MGFARQESGLQRAAFNRLDIVVVSASLRGSGPSTCGPASVNVSIAGSRTVATTVTVTATGAVIHGHAQLRQRRRSCPFVNYSAATRAQLAERLRIVTSSSAAVGCSAMVASKSAFL